MLCTPKGSPASLIYPFGRKLTFFVIKQFFPLDKEHQTLMRSRLRRFLPLGATHLDRKKFDAPHTRLAQDDQVGAQLHTVHHFISPTSKTAMAVFGEHRFVSALAGPQGWYAQR